LDYEKAYDRVNRSKLWSTLGRYKLPVNLLNSIKASYNNTSITIKMGKCVNGTPFVSIKGYDKAEDSPHCCLICI
jgi:hypothetical protein